MTIDINKLKRALMDYYGTAMHSGFPMAVIDLGNIEKMSPEDLVSLAYKLGLNLEDFSVDREEDEIDR